ncbi:MAG: hypothetical protein ABSF59_15420 [Candidatus Sulfotelmatobacter sp.]|jgi:hypothetical protein
MRIFAVSKKSFRSRREPLMLPCAILAGATLFSTAFAENCLTSSDMDAATRSALTGTAQLYFDLIAKGDAAALRQASIPGLANDFSGVESTVKDNQAALAATRATANPPFVLEAEGTAPIPRAEFLCGVFGASGQTSDSAVFTLNNLPPGKYGVVILNASSPKSSYTVSLILQQRVSEWKLGGLYIKSAQSGGHNSAWYADRAREFQAKGQLHNAWFYYLEARSLISPLPFMSTATTDKLYDESQKLQPADLPAEGKTADLGSYKLTALFPEVVGDDLDLVVKYQAADVSNTNQTYTSNVAVMKALLAKYPELKDAFVAVVARAVDPAGHDYGTMLAMKDIK